MKVYVSFFGGLADITGNNLLIVQNKNDVLSLDQALREIFPNLKKFQYKIALRNKIVNKNAILSHGDEIAFLPPFSGG